MEKQDYDFTLIAPLDTLTGVDMLSLPVAVNGVSNCWVLKGDGMPIWMSPLCIASQKACCRRSKNNVNREWLITVRSLRR